jgi:outer membrane lipoprotein-sorting protein
MSSLLLSLVLSSFALACGQDDAAKAKELIDVVAAVTKDAPAIAFETEIQIKVGPVAVPLKAKALLKRPNLARLEISGAGQDALIILDGSTSWHLLKASNGFVKSNQLGTTKLEQYGVGPAATLFFEREAGPLLPYLSNATVTKEKLGEEECWVVTWKVGAEETRLWIGRDRLRRYRTTRSISENVFEQTFTYGAMDLSPAIADEAFVFTPPAGAHAISAGDESKLLAIGTNAPDFTATYLDGKMLKLSDFKGKPVLLSFWFYG